MAEAKQRENEAINIVATTEGNEVNVAKIISSEGDTETSIGDDSTITEDADNRNEKMNLTNNSLDKGAWGSNFSYLLMLVGYAVGFGNIWRFPYQMRENGGLVFLIPFWTMLFALGIPVFFLELAVGQRRRKGMIHSWVEISPIFGGLGICCGWACFLIGLYYNTLIAYCISYFVDSFRYPLPWTNCSTATANMADRDECYNDVNGRSSKYYWNRVTLSISQGIDSPGGYNGLLFLYHLITWLAIYLILWKGTKFVGKVVYFTALFPYLVLTSFFIANFAIEPKKAWLGAYRLLKPDWTTLYSPMVWLKAGSQVFYSLGLACGCLVVFGSYNQPTNDVHKDAVYITVISGLTSVYAALVVFPIIGALGHRKYEKCVTYMKTIFPDLKYLSDEEKYDIYFTTEAQNWGEVAPDKPIIVRYGYGELLDEDKGNFKNTRDNELFEYIVTINSSMPPSKSLQFTLRDCSIGKEATASGGGTGFVFIGFTEAVLRMPWPNFWSILFFTMLITLGIDSGFGTVEGAVALVEESFHMSRFKATSLVCGISTIIALLLFPFGWGLYVLDLLDQWPANWTLLLIALAECIAVAWCYGLAKISYDVKLMVGYKPSIIILVCWKYLTPILILFLMVGSIVELQIANSGTFKYKVFDPKNSKNLVDGEYETDFPIGALVIGFVLTIFCIIWLPIQAGLRKTMLSLVKEESPADFPEEQLREERNIHVEKEEQQFSAPEKLMIGSSSLRNLQEYRDNKSQMDVHVN